jgi:NTP pyrophosphatase (non-canonical NTP hydrolase)
MALNDVQREVMLIAQEECAEVTQAISKIFRFGYEDMYLGKTNKERLEEEVGDLICMIDLMVNNGLIDRDAINLAGAEKHRKLRKWSKVYSGA